jgi:hypothetical protein
MVIIDKGLTEVSDVKRRKIEMGRCEGGDLGRDVNIGEQSVFRGYKGVLRVLASEGERVG